MSDPPTRGRRTGRRIAAITVGVVLSLLAVEVVLQIGHVVVWVAGRSEPRTTADGSRTLLCVGDSFTFGIGSSDGDGPYPAALERLLRARPDGPWTVANEGWPGRNSRELLSNLGAWLERHRPELVCILVGVNDRWSRPTPLPPAAEATSATDDGLRLRWRTGRLLRMILDALTGDDPSRDRSPPLVGAWSMLGERVDFRADGTGSFLLDPLTWRTQDEWIEIEIPGVFHSLASWRGDEHMLQLVPAEGTATEINLERLDAMTGQRIRAATTAVEENRFAFAKTLMAPVLRLTRDDDAWAPALHRAARRLARAAQDNSAAAEHETWLTSRALELDEGDALSSTRVTNDLQSTLEDHLRRAVRLCRARGAIPILITYPYDWEIHAAHERVASESGVELVVTKPVLDALRQAEPDSPLFVGDGHCTDRGYEGIATAVAAAIARALESR